MLKLVSRIAAFLMMLGLGGAAVAATGTALGVDPDAEAQAKGTTRTLVVGADVFIGDRIVTDAKGLVQIEFSDRTRLVVGPRSALVIDDYLLRDNGSSGKFAINALRGTFRFITGGAPKNRYVINTPTGQIGVRGTVFDFYVTDDNTYILQLHGSTIDCPDNRPDACAILDAVCQLGIMDNSKVEVIAHGDALTGDAREAAKAMFRYAFSQRDLLRQFRVQGAERCLRRPVGGGAGGSINEPNESVPEPEGRVIIETSPQFEP